ncbi:GTPase Era [Trichlorobacter ammonificans]|uniref:GTPase Era n=1 Tax=Trichlorobacter ammonificans TaxID=2916410 RepID=A0ABM9D7H2_9BACT|nr:GTPase Era [Trichlorobacter ammonificans]CAH2031170.1 GTPase Era [Trichlorobacter ammonificans]
MTENAYKSGFVSIIGRPNVGKSTLLNRILGEKIVAVSDKPQTTRNVIRGILSDESSQIVFVDTPGIHTARTRINRAMVDAAMSAVTGIDIMLLVVDATQRIEEPFIRDICAKSGAPVFLVLNKIDQVEPKEKLFSVIEGYSRLHDFPEIIPISAQSGSNVERLVNLLRERLPEGVPFFPEDILTDLPEKFICAELIREKVFRLTTREIPYGTAVVVDAFQERENGVVAITATIMVERDTHKGIIIGKQGSMLKKIGQQARGDIERLLGTRVYLELFVQVQERWTERTAMLRELGYE